MATRFLRRGLYLVTIRHRDGGAYQVTVTATNHHHAASQCADALARIWSA